MQSPCIDACKSFKNLALSPLKLLRLHSQYSSFRTVSCSFSNRNSREKVMKVKGKENVWSIDNEKAKAEKKSTRRMRRKRGGGGGRRERNFTRKSKGDKVMVSATMLMEVETVLQTQEPVIRPVWNTFASSVSGIWKGVGAVFSPITAEMEPIDIGNKDEHLFDCYTRSHIEVVPSPGGHSQIRRRIHWVTLNPYGEAQQVDGDASLSDRQSADGKLTNNILPKFQDFDFGRSDVMEEDVMGIEPGLVFFEDGSYSRGPVHIPVGELDESKYYLSPTFKFEQCLVKGCHKRLRIVHTVEFTNGGSDVQILRVAVYEEQWVSPAKFSEQSDVELDLKPFSQRRRVQPSELSGSWKVFEVSATPIYDEEAIIEESDSAGPPYVYLCMENLKKRSLPENPVYFREEEMRDMQDVTVLWLPGGVTAYVDVKKDGILCMGVGWYSDEGVNLVMERDYGMDGKLKEVRWKSELKRRWSNPPPM